MKKPTKPTKPKKFYPQSEQATIVRYYVFCGRYGWLDTEEYCQRREAAFEAQKIAEESDTDYDDWDCYEQDRITTDDLDLLFKKVGTKNVTISVSCNDRHEYQAIEVSIIHNRSPEEISEVKSLNDKRRREHEIAIQNYEIATENYKIQRAQFKLWEAEIKLQSLRRGINEET